MTDPTGLPEHRVLEALERTRVAAQAGYERSRVEAEPEPSRVEAERAWEADERAILEVSATVSSGGHPLPLVLSEDGSAHLAGIPGTIIGVFEDPVLSDRVVDLEPGDALVMYTDGVTDERGPAGAEFGEARLLEVLSDLGGHGAQRIADGVVDAVERFRGSRARDDIAIAVLLVVT